MKDGKERKGRWVRREGLYLKCQVGTLMAVIVGRARSFE